MEVGEKRKRCLVRLAGCRRGGDRVQVAKRCEASIQVLADELERDDERVCIRGQRRLDTSPGLLDAAFDILGHGFGVEALERKALRGDRCVRSGSFLFRWAISQRLRPSTCLILSESRSTPSRQRTLTAAISLPCPSLPRANGEQPHSGQKWW